MKPLASLAALFLCFHVVSAQVAEPNKYAPPAPTASGVIGYWSTDAGSILHIAPCTTGVCIKIMTISQKAPGVVDGNNPDESLRTRPVCKMDIGTGFQLKDDDHAQGGRIYDPETGKTYKSVLISDGNTLSVRGYIGFKALGRTQAWKRTTAKYATCVGTTHR